MSQCSRPRANWNTSIISVATRKLRTDLKEREPQRAALYKATAALVRAFANIADELEPAGYSDADIARIKKQIDHYLKLREIIRKASGETSTSKPTRPTCAISSTLISKPMNRGRFHSSTTCAAGTDREERHCRRDQQRSLRHQRQ